MGFTIYVNKLTFGKNSKGVCVAKQGMTVSEHGFSYNWGDLSNYCPVHYISANEKVRKCTSNVIAEECDNIGCQLSHLWYIKDDLHCRLGNDVARRAQEAINKLQDAGFQIHVLQLLNGKMDYGKIDYGNNLTHLERLEVFMYHLNIIVHIGEQYPDCILIADDELDEYLVTDTDIKIPIIASKNTDFIANVTNVPDVINSNIIADTSSTSSTLSTSVISSTDKKIYTYFQHPAKGLFRVDSFRTAMEVFGVCLAQGLPDVDTNKWYNFALLMHDAPGGAADIGTFTQLPTYMKTG